jgi:hypothetical protein
MHRGGTIAFEYHSLIYVGGDAAMRLKGAIAHMSSPEVMPAPRSTFCDQRRSPGHRQKSYFPCGGNAELRGNVFSLITYRGFIVRFRYCDFGACDLWGLAAWWHLEAPEHAYFDSQGVDDPRPCAFKRGHLHMVRTRKLQRKLRFLCEALSRLCA